MALNWNWSEKCGELTIVQQFAENEKEFTISLYQGNAYLIMLHEFEDGGKEFYDLYGFFNDKEHMRRCFGLGKKSENLHNIYDGWKKIRINKAKYRYTKELVTAITEAFDNISIELYTEE